MNKSKIVALLLEKLRDDFESRSRVSKMTRESGNDSESKAESKYDTLAIEENYLADGLARQALAAAEAMAEIQEMPIRPFAANEPMDLGVLVELDFGDTTEWFFLAPSCGGTKISLDHKVVTVITPESPLGSQLIGRLVGDQTTRPSARIVGTA